MSVHVTRSGLHAPHVAAYRLGWDAEATNECFAYLATIIDNDFHGSAGGITRTVSFMFAGGLYPVVGLLRASLLLLLLTFFNLWFSERHARVQMIEAGLN